MNEPTQIRPGQIYHATQPIRDPLYRRFIKCLPCVGCLKTWWIDPAHTGPHGIGQKACDLTCIPLCRSCHREFDANPRKFAETRKLDIPALIAVFNSFYKTKLEKKVA